MTQINGIGFNPQIKLNPGVKAERGETQEEVKDFSKVEVNHKSADEVLSFLAQTGARPEINNSKAAGARKIEVSKYVTPEQAKRIAGFVNEFTGAVADGLKSIEKEMGNLPLSQAAKLDMAAGAFAKANMPA